MPLAATAAVALLILTFALPAWWQERTAARQWEDLWIKAASDRNEHVRVAAVQSLVAMGSVSERAADTVRKAMSNDSPLVRLAAVERVGETGAEGAPYLAFLKLAQKSDPDNLVRLAAGASIAKISSAPPPPAPSGHWAAVGALLAAIIGAALWYFRLRRSPGTSAAK